MVILACSGSASPGSPAPIDRVPGDQPKSLIIVFLTGAASHLETFDPKPDAPDEIRGEYRAIPTMTPGLLACEHLPKLATRSDRYAVVRSLSHRENNHLVATHHVLTGHQQPGAFFDKIASRNDFPNYAAGRSYFRRAEGTPTGVNLPIYLQEGPLLWPGQYAGFLGPKHDIMQVTQDPNRPDFRIDNLRPPGLDVAQMRDRMALLGAVNSQQRWLGECADTRKLTDQQHQAISVLTSGKVARHSKSTRSRPPFATSTAATHSASRSFSRGGSWRPASRSCRPTWAAFRTGTTTATSSSG